MELKSFEIEMGMKLAIAQNDIMGVNHYEVDSGKKVVVAKKGDIVKVLDEFYDAECSDFDCIYIQVDNWDFEVIVDPHEIKIEEEMEMVKDTNFDQELEVGMSVKVNRFDDEVFGKITEVCTVSVDSSITVLDNAGTLWKFWSNNSDVTILTSFADDVEIVNEFDDIIFNHAYKVSLHNYDNKFYGVYANDEQHALDILVDVLEQKGENGYFYDTDEVFELEKEGNLDMFINAGNHCHYLNAEHVYIEKI